MPARRWGGHAFTIALGVIGWGVVVALPALDVIPTNPATAALPIVLFVLVILAARALAFRLVEGSVLSLDSAYYVAAALCVGSVEAGRLVALALTLDASARLSNKRRKARLDADNWWAELGYVLYFGGMSGGLLVLCGWLLGADSLVGRHVDSITVTIRVVAIAGALLVSHYALQGLRPRLLGQGCASTCATSRSPASSPRRR